MDHTGCKPDELVGEATTWNAARRDTTVTKHDGMRVLETRVLRRMFIPKKTE
jgi:hypothetical protein